MRSKKGRVSFAEGCDKRVCSGDVIAEAIDIHLDFGVIPHLSLVVFDGVFTRSSESNKTSTDGANHS